MATPAGTVGAGEVSVQISAAPADADAVASGESQRREQRLNLFVQVVAFAEWAGSGFGALVFVWATGVVLGSFCSDLKPLDFWFATVIIFIEAFRIFIRNYKMDNQSLFGSTRALRWVNVSFARMLGRPQEGNEVVLIMGLWLDLVSWFPSPVVGSMHRNIFQAALLIFMSKIQLRGASQLTSRSRRHRRLQLWVLLTAFLIFFALSLRPIAEQPASEDPYSHHYYQNYSSAFYFTTESVEVLTVVVAVLLLIFRPPAVANLTNTPWGRRLLSVAKLISVAGLAFGWVVSVWSPVLSKGGLAVDPDSFIIGFTLVVLSLGSLQTPAANSSTCDRWMDVIMHVLFLWYSMVTLPADLLGARQFATITAGLSSILLVGVLLMENLQIPAAALQVLLSSSRVQCLQSDYKLLPQQDRGISPNMVPAIRVFYALALCEGSLYITATILGLFSFFPRRSLVRHSQLTGQRGAQAIDLYYECAYATCMDTGLFAARRTLSLASFATESVSSSSSEMQEAGVLVLGNLLAQGKGTDSSEELRRRIISSDNRTPLSTLVSMLGWVDVRHRDVRMMAAGVIVNLADSLTIAEIPGMLKLASSLLDDADNQPAKNEPAGRQEQDSLPAEVASVVNGRRDQENSVQRDPDNRNEGNAAAGNQRTGGEQLEHGQDDDNGRFYWVCRYWQRMKEKWCVLEEQPLTHQDSLPILGMVILERLARDPDNCAEIVKATYLISKVTVLISYITDVEQQHAVIFSALNLVRRLAITGENIGVALRQELCNNSFLLTNLECVLEDSRSTPEVLKLVIEILAKLAFDKDAREEIGSSKVTICQLMRAFLGKDGATNEHYYDQSLRMAAGEALANLTIESPASCLAILEEPGHQLIKDLKDMLCKDECRYVAASLLKNFSAHSIDKLRHHHDAGDYLSSALPMLMENIMSAGGKQLEALIGLISQIGDVIPEPFVRELQLQTKGSSGLVQRLVGTLNSNRKPNPERPRIRRVIVEMVIAIVKLCPRYATVFREGGMMEALTKVERTPSKVEKYRVFYGNVGVVLESGSPLTALVATAKGLVYPAAPTLSNAAKRD